jgi:Predicted membrane-bound mannosyltransferase
MQGQKKTDEIISNNENSSQKTEDRAWLLGCALVTAVAVFLRFYDLTLKPMHHDEGVNGHFLTTLFREGSYRYDPSNYHGPTLYYIALAFSKVFGLETFSVRASVAVFGVLMVAMIFFLRRYIGTVGSLAAGMFIALSPGMVYISRYFIHEIFFVFCSLCIVLGVLFFIEGRKPGALAVGALALIMLVCFLPPALNLIKLFNLQSQTAVFVFQVALFLIEAVLVFLVVRMLMEWNDGRPIYLLLASASLALFFATKETAFITVGTMLIAFVCIIIWRKVYGGMFEGKLGDDDLAPVPLTWKTFRESLGGRQDCILILLASLVIFLYVGVVFFSSFFTYAEGVVGAVKAYAFWTKTGSSDHTQNGYLAYLKWLWQLEAPILILSAIGILIAFLKARHRFAMFAGLWAFGLFLAYTLIPYKTPWLALSFILPMGISAGYAVNEIYMSRDRLKRTAAGLIAAVAFGVLGYQTVDLNFYRYDDDELAYVYAHTRRGFLDMVRQIEYYAEKSGKGENATVEIVSPDYWSLPWYLRNYPNATFHGRIVPANSSEMIVAKKGVQEDEVRYEYAPHYKLVGEYPLRPGVDLILLVRRDLADSDAKELTDSSLGVLELNEMRTFPLIEDKTPR